MRSTWGKRLEGDRKWAISKGRGSPPLLVSLSTGEIASRLGVAPTNGFYKAFKRWTGLSPRRYHARQEIR